jgi:hypothetical protein
MRMAFGLAGLLVTVGIMVYVWSFYTAQAVRSAAQVRPVAEQIAGVESGGLAGHVSDHMKLTEYAANGKLQAITVTRLDAGSSMESYYGLRQGDQIIEVGPMKVRDMDGGLAIAMVQEAYQRQESLVVVRDGRTLSLPQMKNVAAPYAPPAQPQAAKSPAPAPAPAPAAPAQQPVQPRGNSLQRQLDAIRNYGGQ